MMYEVLASYYDALVKDEEATRAWVTLIEQNISGKCILEAACGSGEITIALAKKGYQITAFDLSEQMVEQAKQKPGSELVEWQVQDMRSLPKGCYDAILCLCDSFNYLLTKEEVHHFFVQCYQHLNAGGTLIVDMHSMERLQEFEEEYNETGCIDGHDYQWTIESEDDRIYQSFAFYDPDGHMQLEQHVQRVYDPAWILKELNDCSFEVSVKTDFDKEGIVPGEKQFYICRRKEQ